MAFTRAYLICVGNSSAAYKWATPNDPATANFPIRATVNFRDALLPGSGANRNSISWIDQECMMTSSSLRHDVIMRSWLDTSVVTKEINSIPVQCSTAPARHPTPLVIRSPPCVHLRPELSTGFVLVNSCIHSKY